MKAIEQKDSFFVGFKKVIKKGKDERIGMFEFINYLKTKLFIYLRTLFTLHLMFS